ncbi:MAG: T9SS C-terminal target domain-containing protein, partial [Bacteroidetes bacterium]
QNRRQSEYVASEAFLAFVTEELVPAIDAAYRTRASADGRAIVGTSLGGLNAAFFGARRPDVFRYLGIQSPAFWVWTDIYDLYRDALRRDVRIYLSNGTLHDGTGGPTMAAILEEKGYDYVFREKHEGHSWGQWRGLLDEMLIYFFGEGGVVATEPVTPPAEDLALRVVPNPFAAGGRVMFTLAHPAHVRLDVYDLLGRRVAVLADGRYAAGTHTLAPPLATRAPGVYLLRLTAGAATATRPVVVP